MTPPAWMIPTQIIAWLVPYLLLVAGRRHLDAWLNARFQRRSWPGKAPVAGPIARLHEWQLARELVSRHTSPNMPAVAGILASVVALLSGAMLPLAPTVRVGSWKLPLHLSGNTSSALLLVLALEWVTTGLLALTECRNCSLDSSVRRPGSQPMWSSVSLMLLDVLPVTLITLSLVMTASAWDIGQEGCLRLTTLISLQGSDQALPRWLATRQPLAALMWLISAAPFRPRSQARMSFAWQAHALNRALLTTTVLLGGWQGPYAGTADALAPAVWLGLAYTTIKAGFVTFIWGWVWASLPKPALMMRSRVVWRVLVPAAAINLILTSVAVATR
jgi:NADH:ubiquinone oxidoreductase subunit H